jgi:hypothetical protein
VVGAAQGNRKLVADPPAQCPRLCKSQMVGVGRPAPAQQARLRCHELQVRAIAVAVRFAQRGECSLDEAGIRGREGVLCAERPLRPRRGLFLRDKARQLAEQLVSQAG